jgi:hypothetical protein
MTITVETPNPLTDPTGTAATALNIVSALTTVTEWLERQAADMQPAVWGHLLLLQAARNAAEFINDTQDNADMKAGTGFYSNIAELRREAADATAGRS